MKVERLPDGSLAVRVRPGLVETVLILTALLPALLPAIAPYLPRRHFTVETSEHFWVVSVIALAGLAVFAEWSDFVFDPRLGRFRWKRRRAFSIREGSAPLAAIEALWVHTIRTDSDGTPKHRVVVHTSTGSVPLTDSFATGSRSRGVARQIHEFLTERGLRPRLDDDVD